MQEAFIARHKAHYRKTCLVILNGLTIPQAEDASYLGLHLDRRLNWRKHIFTKRKQLGIQLSKMYRMLGTKSQLSIESKLLLYEAILKSIWTYGVQLWSTNSNIKIIQRFQNKYLRIIVNAPWYVNDTLHHDLNVSYVKDEIKKLSQRYADRLEERPNILASDLMSDAETPRRLKRKLPQDLYI